MYGSTYQRRGAAPSSTPSMVVGAPAETEQLLGEEQQFGDNASTPLLLSRAHSPGLGWSIFRGLVVLTVMAATTAALVIAIVALVRANDGATASSDVGSSLLSLQVGETESPADTLIVGRGPAKRFLRPEAGCALAVHIKENALADPPGLKGLRFTAFDLAACIAGGFEAAPSAPVPLTCASAVLPPPTGALPSPGTGCPFGTYTAGTVYATGGITVPSDSRVKEQVAVLDTAVALATLNALRPVSYYHTEEYAADTDSPYRYRRHGFIAQEVEAVLPQAVRTVGSHRLGNGDVIPDFKMMRKEELIVELVAAVQELTKRNGELEDLVMALESRVTALE